MWLIKAHTSQEAPTSISGSSSLIASGSRQIMKKLNNSHFDYTYYYYYKN